MRLKNLRRDNSALSKTVMVIFVVIILIAASALAVVLTMSGSSGDKKVQDGDTITLDYIGYVIIDGEVRVFDTTQWDVVIDNTTWPKAVWYVAKSEAKSTPFEFTVGAGTVVTGFDQGVVGLEEGESKTIEIPYSQGYGAMTASKLKTFNINDTLPIYVTTTTAAFNSTFGELPVTGLTVTHPVYNWPVKVLSVDELSDEVLYWNAPTYNGTYHVYGASSATTVAGWNILITGYDTSANSGEGLISFSHQINETDSWNVIGYSGSTLFYLIDVNTTAGTAVMNSNTALKGQTMFFDVTIVSITRA